MDDKLRSFIEAIPKAELHVHLDSVDPVLMLRFAERNGVQLPFSDVEGARRWYQFNNLEQFLDKWKITTTVLQTEEDYYEVALELGRDMDLQNIVRRETMFTYAAAHEARGVPLETVVNGLAAGRRDVMREYDVDLYFLADIDRTISPERSLAYVNTIADHAQDTGIIGIGLDCQEIGYPAALHKAAFARAGELGFRRSAHSGEEYVAGTETIWSAIQDLHVDRIDHGNQGIRDAKLVDYLVETGLPLTLCPLSNVAIGIYPDLAAHPVKQLIDRGVTVTINSDDPPFFDANLNENFLQLAEVFELGAADIAALVRNGFTCCFAGDAEKQAYLARLDAWLNDNATAQN